MGSPLQRARRRLAPLRSRSGRSRTQLSTDLAVRLAAFAWLKRQTELHGEVLLWGTLQRGFEFAGQRVPLLSLQGIFKPQILELPLSIRSSASGPYDDAFSGEHLLYRYRGTDPRHHENEGLRSAMAARVPLVYLHAVMPGRYLPSWPVYVVGDDETGLTFEVAVDDERFLQSSTDAPEVAEPRREYITALVRRRLHQAAFREHVLRAYRGACAMCRLRHRQLLDAAHIVPDVAPQGLPRISNGLALCKLHHAAFDSFFLTVDPDYRIVVCHEVLDEEDGPMLLHGLQALHGVVIQRPFRPEWRPSREALAMRLESFHAAR